MKNSKLFQLLATFSPKEKERFMLFLQSPYHNTQSIFVDFWTILKPLLEQMEGEITKETVFQILFPAKKYDYKLLSNYASRLLTLAETFLCLESDMERKTTKQTTLLRILKERGLHKHFKNKYNTISKSNKQVLEQPEKYLQLHQQHYLLHEWHQETYEPYNKVVFNNFQTTLSHLDAFFILKKLILGLESIALGVVYSKEIEVVFMNELSEQVQQLPHKDNVLIQLYYQAYEMYQGAASDKTYFTFKQMLLSTQYKIDKRTLNELLYHLLNYANIQINLGKDNFKSESLYIYEVLSHHNLLFHEPANILMNYRNIISIACRNGQLKWAKDFIEQNKTKLPKYSKDCYHFGLGLYYFYSKDFQKATAHFNQTYDVSDVDIYYEINRRNNYMRSIYESDKYFNDDSINVFNVHKDWCKRQTRLISKKQANRYVQSISFLIKLYRLKHKLKLNSKAQNQQKFNKIQKEFEANSVMVAKEWLTEKMEEIRQWIK